MKGKICGMKDRKNLQQIISLQPDYLGFIFYQGSPRFMRSSLAIEDVLSVPETIKKVGVFVNETIDKITSIAKEYQLDLIQLHGNESVSECEELKTKGHKIIKAIGFKTASDLKQLSLYKDVVDYFLFDTSGCNYGGNGVVFDWQILNEYFLDTPFFLSGGIGEENIESAMNLKHEYLFGVDANSKLESKPGFKDYNKTKQFINAINKKK